MSRRQVALAVYLLGGLLCVRLNASPAIALAAGLVLALAIPNPLQKRCRWLSKWALQISVVLLGFGMDIHAVLKAGSHGLAFAAGTIVASFVLGVILSRLLHVASGISTLISAGTAICGGSAIAAVGAATGAGESEMSVALGTVFILNGVALYLFPALGHLLGLSQSQFGLWAGIAIHDVSSVVAATGMYGHQAQTVGTAVKLARALWIFPVALVAGRLSHRQGTQVKVPWFIFLFLGAALLSSFSPAVLSISPPLHDVAERGMALTLYLIGSTLSWPDLQAVGWRPLAQGVVQWVLLGVAALLAVWGM